MGLKNLYAELLRPTAVFGLQLWMVIGAVAGGSLLLVFLLLLVIPLCGLISRRRTHKLYPQGGPTISVRIDVPKDAVVSVDRRGTAPPPPPEAASSSWTTASTPTSSNACGSGGGGGGAPAAIMGWGERYTWREVVAATGGFAEENLIGEGGFGIVYRGIFSDDRVVAIKNLLNNRGQAEKEFRAEVEAIGRVRHKNLVKLFGYCIEGSYRMLVYEYVVNGNLDRWLHGDVVGEVSPLTWDIRMNIILGTAKGLAYLHEGLEPKVVHRDVKSSNILLDRQWNPKVSDFGLAKTLQPGRTHVTTRVMGTFGYVAPEYAGTGMLNEQSDVYSFGVLVMEIISGRAPVDYTRPEREVNLVEWLKSMVKVRKADDVVDPKMPEKPNPKALKKVLLVALHCVDPDARQRPKMGQVVYMLEMDDFPFRDACKAGRETCGRSDRHSARREGSAGVIIRQTGDEDANR